MSMKQDLFVEVADGGAAGSTEPRRGELSEFEARVANDAADHDISAAMVHYARELVALEDGLSDIEKRAFLLLVLASIVESRNGSTRLPLDTRPDDYLGELVADLHPDSMPSKARAGSCDIASDTILTDLLATLDRMLDEDIPSTIIGGPNDYRPLIVADGYLYHQRMLHDEDQLVAAIKRRLDQPDIDLGNKQVGDALDETMARMPPADSDGPGDDRDPMQLNAEQQFAVLTAVHRPLTVISGGPGTGKTAIVMSLLRMLNRLGVAADDIALAAPTGKAAHRLGEATAAQLAALPDGPGQRPSADAQLADKLHTPHTLHRLLGFSPGRNHFHYHAHNPLPHDVVIVDEASMIDLFLMERLLDAVGPHARLVLLGDAEQLPSVEAGAVFRDLVPARVDTRASWRNLVEPPMAKQTSDEPTATNAARLKTSYRMDPTSPAGGMILRAARSINAGRAGPLVGPNPSLVAVRRDVEDLALAGVEHLASQPDAAASNPVLMNEFIDWWYTELIGALDEFNRRICHTFDLDGAQFSTPDRAKLTALFDHFGRSRVLTITRVFATGSQRLNSAFHARHRQALRGAYRGGEWAVGEPVIMLKNDYERGLFNGDQGLILRVNRTDKRHRRTELMAVFRRRGTFVAFSLQPLRRHLEHAFALTVHKAQGSEYDAVAIILPADNIPLLTREILYTGMTRSRHAVVLVGNPARLEDAADNPVRRFSGVGEKLAV